MNENVLSLLFLAALIVLMYFTLIRPQKKKEKETNAMRSQLMVGDEVVTIGGFVGKIVKTKEESVILQINGDRTKMEVMRWGISKVVEEGTGRIAVTDANLEDDEPVKKPARPKRMKRAEEVSEPAAEEVKPEEEAKPEEE